MSETVTAAGDTGGAGSLPAKQVDVVGSVVGQIVENILDTSTPIVAPAVTPPLAPAPSPSQGNPVRPPAVKDGQAVANKDGTVRRGPGRPTNAEKAARAAAAAAGGATPPPPASPAPATQAAAAGPSQAVTKLPLVIPGQTPPPDLAALAAAAAAEEEKRRIDVGARVAGRTAIIVLRRVATMYAGEPIPFDKTADFDERSDIRTAVEEKVRASGIPIPEELELVALMGQYLAKATETEKGKSRTQKLAAWCQGKYESLWARVFKKKAPAA